VDPENPLEKDLGSKAFEKRCPLSPVNIHAIIKSSSITLSDKSSSSDFINASGVGN
jgi:hypothetical protein